MRKGLAAKDRLFLKRRKILRQMNIHELICTWCQFYLDCCCYCWERLKKGSKEEHQDCPEGHFPKLNFILKLNVNEFNGSSHCRSLLGGVQCRELISVMRAPLVIKHLMSIFPFFPSLQFFSGNVLFFESGAFTTENKIEILQSKTRKIDKKGQKLKKNFYT